LKEYDPTVLVLLVGKKCIKKRLKEKKKINSKRLVTITKQYFKKA
jgi:hypothetical protein